MGITTFFQQHSLKLAIAFALFCLLCWLYCLSPLSINLGPLQKALIYLGLEIFYDVLRHWCLKLAKMGCDRLRQVSGFVDELCASVVTLKTELCNLQLYPLTMADKLLQTRLF